MTITIGRLALAAGVVVAALGLRRDLLVRAIRGLDRRGGLSTRRAHRAYAAVAWLFSGLHQRVAVDAAVAIGSSDATVVDIGCGPGDVLAEVARRAPQATLIGVEPSEEMRAIAAARGIHAVDGRAEQLPFPEGTVDLVLSSLSSHHWDDAVAAFAEIARVLRPGAEARIYDVRMSGFGPGEARRLAVEAGMSGAAVRHEILDERLLGVRPYALITIRPWRPAYGRPLLPSVAGATARPGVRAGPGG